MSIIQRITPHDMLPHAIASSIYALTMAMWPPAEGVQPKTLDEKLELWREQQSAYFIIARANEVLAHARIFARIVSTQRGDLTVGALAGVCVRPECRGSGWGADVVRAAFDYMPHLPAKVALFQTGVPLFYEKRGCRVVANNFVNGDGSGNPFSDTHVMIYPAEFDWPEGQIDLNGPGY